jgi:ADP-heptose:LPS heptosyltransferase
MPIALLTSKNLIGDGMYIQPSLEEWAKDHSDDWDIHLLTLDDHVACIYERMEIPRLQTVFGRIHRTYDFEFNFDVSQAFKISDQDECHISVSYAKMLGFEPERVATLVGKTDSGKPKYAPRRVKFYVTDKDDHEKGLILLSMFSASCASRDGKAPNKMLSWAHWNPILTLLRQYGKVVSLGGPNDFPQLQLSEDERYHSLPLEFVARMMRDSKLLVTIDNGMSHLGASQLAPMVEFYPACLGLHYIVPPGYPKMLVKQMDPNLLNPADATIVVKEALKQLWCE